MTTDTTFKRILFCTDFSENADTAFDYAVNMTRANPGAVLYLLHVIPEPEAQFWKTYLYEVDEVDRKARRDIDAKIAASYLSRAPKGTHLEVCIAIGRASSMILEIAHDKAADLIVIGRQGRGDLRKVLFGNVTERIARKAECPVLIVPLCSRDARP